MVSIIILCIIPKIWSFRSKTPWIPQQRTKSTLTEEARLQSYSATSTTFNSTQIWFSIQVDLEHNLPYETWQNYEMSNCSCSLFSWHVILWYEIFPTVSNGFCFETTKIYFGCSGCYGHDWRLLHIEELMIHVIVNLSRHSLWGAAHTAGHSSLNCASQIPWLQDKFTEFSGEHLLEFSCFLVRKLCKGSKEQKGDLLLMARTCTALMQCAMGKSIQALSNAAWMQGTQHMMGCKIYLPPIFLLLFCLTKVVTLLSCLLLNLSYWDLEKAVHHLSLPPHPIIQNKESKLKWDQWLTYKQNIWNLLEFAGNFNNLTHKRNIC